MKSFLQKPINVIASLRQRSLHKAVCFSIPLFAFVCCLLPAHTRAGQVELQSDFTGDRPARNLPWNATSVINPTFQFNGWTLGDGMRPTSDDNVFGFDQGGSGTDVTLSEAISVNSYLSCTLESTAGLLDVGGAQVDFKIVRNKWWSARQFAVFTSVDGFNTGDQIFISEEFDNDDRYEEFQLSFILPTERYQSIDGPLEIRIVPYLTRYGGHTVSMTAFSLTSGIETYELTLNAGAGGQASGSPEKSLFSVGDTAILSATPDEGCRFVGWSGSITGKGNPRHIVMDADQNITALFEPLPDPQMEVGINMGGISDWTTAMIFKDVFKRTRSWMTRDNTTSSDWQTGQEAFIPMDDDGWPLEVPFDPGNGEPEQIVHTILVKANEAGPYTLFYEGTGFFSIWINGQPSIYPVTDGSARTQSLTLAAYDRLAITIMESGPAPDHLRNFKLVHDSYLSSYESEPFHPLLMDRSAGFSVYRFMGWEATNNSELEHWDDRTTASHYTQSCDTGIAAELIIQFCNQQNSDAWICIPHKADDDFVRETARLFRDQLNPGLRVYVEYSNETWNSIFSQLDYIYDQGGLLNLNDNEWTAANKFAAKRSAQIWKIFADEFAEQAEDRVVNVLGTLIINSSVTQMRLDALNDPAINTDQVFADVLAVAPYFGHNYSTDELPPNVPEYPTAEEVAGSISQTKIEALREDIAEQKALADLQGLKLVCYEGGQHFTSPNDDTLQSILEDANRHPLMYRRYIEYMDMLQEEGVELYGNFNLCGKWSNSGMWGNLEAIDQPFEEAMKYAAVSDWIAENLLQQNLLQIEQVIPDADTLSVIWQSKPTHTYHVEISTNEVDWISSPVTEPCTGFLTTNILSGVNNDLEWFVRVLDEE